MSFLHIHYNPKLINIFRKAICVFMDTGICVGFNFACSLDLLSVLQVSIEQETLQSR